ncbi:hypothetical protein OIE68_41970 [Nocardia vinacea]|uniref:hypothetical protein n=1 Tax=Nocardia vinacea TaxID=96468 RepID=UPI002E100CDF|nr:hypothetical protein OIE68_41970 [Nocardia vinacea]
MQTPSRFGYGFDSDAFGAGLTLLPLTAGTLIAAVAVSLMIRRMGPKSPMVLGTVVATATFVFLLFCTPSTGTSTSPPACSDSASAWPWGRCRRCSTAG